MASHFNTRAFKPSPAVESLIAGAAPIPTVTTAITWQQITHHLAAIARPHCPGYLYAQSYRVRGHRKKGRRIKIIHRGRPVVSVVVWDGGLIGHPDYVLGVYGYQARAQLKLAKCGASAYNLATK